MNFERRSVRIRHKPLFFLKSEQDLPHVLKKEVIKNHEFKLISIAGNDPCLVRLQQAESFRQKNCIIPIRTVIAPSKSSALPKYTNLTTFIVKKPKSSKKLTPQKETKPIPVIPVARKKESIKPQRKISILLHKIPSVHLMETEKLPPVLQAPAPFQLCAYTEEALGPPRFVEFSKHKDKFPKDNVFFELEEVDLDKMDLYLTPEKVVEVKEVPRKLKIEVEPQKKEKRSPKKILANENYRIDNQEDSISKIHERLKCDISLCKLMRALFIPRNVFKLTKLTEKITKKRYTHVSIIKKEIEKIPVTTVVIKSSSHAKPRIQNKWTAKEKHKQRAFTRVVKHKIRIIQKRLPTPASDFFQTTKYHIMSLKRTNEQKNTKISITNSDSEIFQKFTSQDTSIFFKKNENQSTATMNSLFEFCKRRRQDYLSVAQKMRMLSQPKHKSHVYCTTNNNYNSQN